MNRVYCVCHLAVTRSPTGVASADRAIPFSVTLLAVIGLSMPLGCGGSKFEFADVSGRVMLDGSPVPEAKVVFMPTARNEGGESGPYSQGRTDAEGRFELATVEDSPRSGAVVGPHRVVVSTKRARLDPVNRDVEIVESPETIPWQYTYYKRTPLSYDVPSGGSDAAELLLESTPQ